MDLDSVEVLGCDEAVVISLRNGRVIQQLEELLQNHCNGLYVYYMVMSSPCDILFLHLDGTTAEPKGSSRPIGKSLTEYTELHYTIVLTYIANTATAAYRR